MLSRGLLLVGALVAVACGSRDRGSAFTGGNASAGEQAIVHYGCGSCHTIGLVAGAHGQVGPPLSGIGNRAFVAGELPNEPVNLIRWIQHPHSINDRTAMPDLGVTSQDAKDIAAFLYNQ